MALDQVAADVYAALLLVAPGYDPDGDDTPADIERKAATAVLRSQALLPEVQAVVDAIADGEPATERVVDLRAGLLEPPGPTSWLLLCSDRRVVWATTAPPGPTVQVFALGELAVDRRLAAVVPTLDPGPPPTLEVPRVWAGDKDLVRAIERAESTPDPVRKYVERVGAVEAGTAIVPFRLQVPRSEPGAAPTAVPASWLPDPRGRHELRWWDGSTWTDVVADGEVTGSDPV